MKKTFNFTKAEKSEIRKRVAARTDAKFSKFNSEIRKSVLTAVVAAFSFLIALSWKELITEWIGMISIINPIHVKIFEVAIITVVSVSGILIFTHFLKENE